MQKNKLTIELLNFLHRKMVQIILILFLFQMLLHLLLQRRTLFVLKKVMEAQKMNLTLIQHRSYNNRQQLLLNILHPHLVCHLLHYHQLQILRLIQISASRMKVKIRIIKQVWFQLMEKQEITHKDSSETFHIEINLNLFFILLRLFSFIIYAEYNRFYLLHIIIFLIK
mgnify:CR=1 FL=1